MTQSKAGMFDNLKRIASTLVQTFGRNCEVAIHDFDLLPHSLIYIEGDVTNRKPGAPITDLVLRELRSGKGRIEDIPNYRTISNEGRTLKSSTTFLFDDGGKVSGAFCINFDITDYLNAMSVLDEFTTTADPNEDPRDETFATSLGETMASLMEESIRKLGKQPATMTREEKVKLVQSLEFQGAFMIRGAVEHVAKAMGVSKFTVYNYLKEVRS
ncbi:MAG: helix-turn-helix transcriptional regulator [Desulfobacterales bacterium]|jgi:predicted transcriptional regulator YheO